MKSLCLAASIVLAASSAAFAQPLDGYTARLSANDHYNSRGQRLDNAAAIIRQDRANYYVYGGGDPEDEGDSFFASKANRARLERMLRRGTLSGPARREIVNGAPLIHVEIYDDFIDVQILD